MSHVLDGVDSERRARVRNALVMSYRYDLLGALALATAALASCAPSTPKEESAPAQATPPPPMQALPERSCEELARDAHAVITAHNTCTADAECATAAAACPGGFACGLAVRASDIAQVNAEVAPISDRYKAQCKECARERVRCMKPNPVCSEGRCAHAPSKSDCDRLEQEAEALIQKHNSCSSDADCVFARGGGGCPMAFGCGVVVNKAQEQAFVTLADPLSATFHEQCGFCAATVAECAAATPICSAGHCSRKREP